MAKKKDLISDLEARFKYVHKETYKETSGNKNQNGDKTIYDVKVDDEIEPGIIVTSTQSIVVYNEGYPKKINQEYMDEETGEMKTRVLELPGVEEAFYLSAKSLTTAEKNLVSEPLSKKGRFVKYIQKKIAAGDIVAADYERLDESNGESILVGVVTYPNGKTQRVAITDTGEGEDDFVIFSATKREEPKAAETITRTVIDESV